MKVKITWQDVHKFDIRKDSDRVTIWAEDGSLHRLSKSEFEPIYEILSQNRKIVKLND